MTLITQKDFDSRAGQEKIVQAIHTLERKIHELDQKIQTLHEKEDALQRDVAGYDTHEE